MSFASLIRPAATPPCPAEVELHHLYPCRAQPFDMSVLRPQTYDSHLVRDAGLRGDKASQHGLGTADAKICGHDDDLARPRLHAHRARQTCSP